MLRGCALFSHLEPTVRDKIVARARVRRFAPRATIFSTGAARDSLMAVISGQVQITALSPGGKEVVLAILHPGEVFGEIALLDGKERSADARAMTECKVGVIDRADVLQLLDQHPRAWRGFVEVLCERLRRTDNHLVEMALLDLPARLARALLRSADANRIVRLSQRDLGKIVGASRERVNNRLQEWQRAGLLSVDKGSIVVRDEAALVDTANSHERGSMQKPSTRSVPVGARR